MNKSSKKIKIRKKDYNRVLVTETAPYETPIIFSNEGFYGWVRESHPDKSVHKSLLEFLIFNIPPADKIGCTIPFFYKIRKTSVEYRRLGLIHPSAQWKVRKFYETYENFIIYLCGSSPASIRAPQSIASTYYEKTSWSNINQYKDAAVTTADIDEYTQYSPSFFSYRGHDRLHKFFDSPDYFRLEKRFNHFRTLDVSKCFDSIYTHSLSWAVKDKEFTKVNVNVRSTFSQQFDGLMQYANHRETNGIVIGPEVSRIFAEIILQEVDRKVINELKSHPFSLKFGEEYSFRRYVDDVLIFAKEDKIAKAVYDCFADKLISFNLHANHAKSVTLSRPFVTKKSAIIREANQKANEFIEKFLESHDGRESLVPKKIHHNWKLTKSFLDIIKSLCLHNSSSYDDIASYLISVFTERIKKLVNITASSDELTMPENYKDAIIVILEVLFFIYSVAPSVGASYKLATSIVLIARFTKKHIPIYIDTIYQMIYNLAEEILFDSPSDQVNLVEGLVSLESINVMLALRELGENYLLPEKIIEHLFFHGKEIPYFHIVSCLFYIRDNKKYEALKSRLNMVIVCKLEVLSDVQINTEKAILLLDMFCCPYIESKQKKQWIIKLFQAIGQPEPSSAEKNHFLSDVKHKYWFVNWRSIDLLHCLEKKELKQAY